MNTKTLISAIALPFAFVAMGGVRVEQNGKTGHSFVAASVVDTKYPVADEAVRGNVTLPISKRVLSFPNGKINWLYNPTQGKKPFNPEWTWSLNRMGFWNEMAKAYRTTGDAKYAEAFARQLTDWLDQTGGKPPERNYNGVGSPFRTIEEGLRLMNAWHTAWHAFTNAPAFTPELQTRFRASAQAQAKHLMAHTSSVGNWRLMEMNGLYAYATDFPDDPESTTMRRVAADRLAKAMREQILPDGLQYELSPDYHAVAINCASQLYGTALAGGCAAELPGYFKPLLERMADAVLALTTPSFVQPRFNDCFTMDGTRMVGRIAPFFPERADFAWMASRREKGTPPNGETASRFLPWGGFAALRSDWSADATYLAFDFGPLGMQHYHQDKLSFTLWKGGEELVFDDGGGQYDNSEERRYALSGYDHNTLLVDGLAQHRLGPKKSGKTPSVAEWRTTPTNDYVAATYDQGFGPKELRLAAHRRAIDFDKAGDCFTIVDEIRSVDGAEHTYELLFQLDTTNVTLSADRRVAVTHYGRRYDLEIATSAGATMTTLVAQRTPRLAGWYVGRNDATNHPATTLVISAPKSRDSRVTTTLKILNRPAHD